MANRIKIISIDFQKDFSLKGGACYRSRPSVEFVKEKLIPFLSSKKIEIAEIISDYRQPRAGAGKCCCPGEPGYESEIPSSVKNENIWIKSMNSPIWIREGAGDAKKKPGAPFQAPEKFTEWLDEVIGKPEEVDEVVLFGLTLDCCVLSVAQELDFRGYEVRILEEGTDSYSGDPTEKEMLFKSPLGNWAEPISWGELRGLME